MNKIYDRVLVIKKKEGTPHRAREELKTGLKGKAIANASYMDGMRLHIKRSTIDNLWRFYVEQPGILNEGLKVKFTKWEDIFKFAEQYIERRNCFIQEVIDTDV